MPDALGFSFPRGRTGRGSSVSFHCFRGHMGAGGGLSWQQSSREIKTAGLGRTGHLGGAGGIFAPPGGREM